MSKDKKYIDDACKAVSAIIPDNHAFIVIAAPTEGQGDNRVCYGSSMERESAISLIKQLLAGWGLDEKWMEHCE